MSNTKKQEVELKEVPKIEKITEELKVKKFSKEELMARVREANLKYQGRVHIDEKYKKPDKVLRIDNDDAATRAYMKSLGYTIVQDEIPVGSGSLRESSNMGSAVHVELAIYGQSQPGILYEIDKDLYEARQAVEAEQNSQRFHQKVDEMTYEGMSKPKK